MKKITFLVVCFLMFMFVSDSYTQITYVSNRGGNWSEPRIWTPNGVPTQEDEVIISDNNSVIVDIDANCKNLYIAGGNNASSLTINGVFSLNVSESVVLEAGTNNNANKNILVGNGALTCSSITMADLANQNRDCYVWVSTGTVTVLGDISMNGEYNENQFEFKGAGTLYIGGNITGGSLITVSGCTVEYNGNGPQTMYQTNYLGNVICSGSGTKTFGTTGMINSISGDLTIKTGSGFMTADINSPSVLELSVNGTFTVQSGASVTIGGVNNYGGRLIINGIRNHIIQGNINIYFALRFNGGTTSGTQSTVAVKSPAIITAEYSTGGQLYLSNNVIFTVESGAEFKNNNVKQSYYLGGIYNDNLIPPPTLIIDGTLTNGPGGCITNEGVFKINGMFYYPSGWWGTGNKEKPIEYGENGKLIYSGGSLTISDREWPILLSPPNVTIQSTGTITLDKSRTISKTLHMISGNINTGAFTLTLGTSTTNLGTLDYTSGNIITGATGGFKRWFSNSTVSNVYFPVGTASTINMIRLSFTGAPTTGGSLTAKFIAANPGAVMQLLYDGSYLIDCYSQRGYWQLDAGDGLTGGTYSISLRGQGFNPNGNEITNYTELRVLKRTNGSGNPWTVPPTTHVPATGDNSDPTIQREGLSGFSQFGMGGNWGRGNPLEGPLPVKLTSFSSVLNGRDVKLNWVTESEENNEGFEVQKSVVSSKEAGDWMKIGFVQGKGTKNSLTNYSFEDRNLQTGKYKYRLKQIDYNGNYEYFELAGIVDVGVPKKFDLSQNYPNPFNPVTKINFDLPESGLVSLKVYDILSKEVATLVNETREAGYYTIDFDAGRLSSGVYFYRLNANGFSSVKRLVVMK